MADVSIQSEVAQSHRRLGRPTSVSILGATGSIGKNTLDLVSRHPDRFEIAALTAQTNVDGLARLAKTHRADLAVIGDDTRYHDLKDALAGTGIEVAAGEAALVAAACRPVDCVMAAIIGAAGLRPTFAAAEHAKRIALANKECLVSAGDAFMAHIAKHGVELLPVDSEHSGVFQAIAADQGAGVEHITLTASGGPFRDWNAAQIAQATIREALNHPNWSMGDKITIDSATMMNKGLELIEAYHLFPVQVDQLSCVVHPQSVVHCLVAFQDGSTLAQLAMPDMRTPIAYALGWPERIAAPTKRLDIAALSGLEFEEADEIRFPCLSLARTALEAGGAAPTVLNAANEVAVSAFLAGQIKFGEIAAIVAWALERADRNGLTGGATTLRDVCAIDREARMLSLSRIKNGS